MPRRIVTLYDWERLNPGDWGRHVVAYGQVVGRVARGATLPEDVVCNDPRINAVHIWLRTPRLRRAAIGSSGTFAQCQLGGDEECRGHRDETLATAALRRKGRSAACAKGRAPL